MLSTNASVHIEQRRDTVEDRYDDPTIDEEAQEHPSTRRQQPFLREDMRIQRRGPSLSSLKKLFFGLMVLVVMMCVVIQYNADDLDMYIPPPPVEHKRFLTSVCDDGRRLGNMLFNYASLIGVAKTNNMTAVMSDSFSLGNIFRLKVLRVRDLENTMGIYTEYMEYGGRSSAYDIGTASLPQPWNIKLHGYMQSWKYFQSANAELRSHLIFKSHILDAAQKFLHENTPPTWMNTDFIRVGVHVRRGDILLEYFRNFGYITPGPDYFRKAIDFFKTKYSSTKIQFVVCSDDIEWCKNNIEEENMVYSEGHTDSEDLAILSRCNHHIISVGSFGWWAAWLANGTTVYYGKWPKEYSMLEYHVEKKDYFYPYWTPMS